eukprot:1146977-Pelagomonas_calceolata.AAC.2
MDVMDIIGINEEQGLWEDAVQPPSSSWVPQDEPPANLCAPGPVRVHTHLGNYHLRAWCCSHKEHAGMLLLTRTYVHGSKGNTSKFD